MSFFFTDDTPFLNHSSVSGRDLRVVALPKEGQNESCHETTQDRLLFQPGIVVERLRGCRIQNTVLEVL